VIPWAGFAGALSYTFDDATNSQVAHKADMLALDAKFTFYLTTGAGGKPMDAMYSEARDLGHELGNHTQGHGHNAPGSDAEAMQSWLMDNHQVVAYTLAAPYGETSNLVDITNQKFLLDRGVQGGTIGADGNANWTNLPTALPNGGEANFKPYADTAAQGKWQTVCIHGFNDVADSSYLPVDFNGWKAGVEYAQTKNVWLGSMVQVAAYLIGGKAVSSATPMADGEGQKWTWTLKDTFPPGHYVRVTVDGGTLSQGGTPLVWNEHGFYEVSLDEGELTLSP
jgi:peptidoglycan/xylan/chitin deacetylase (PgdA/CDA1 family)